MKIDVRELRIDNLFVEKHSGEVITVESVSKKAVGFSGEFYGNWQAEPIPITEEWLLRFGFEPGPSNNQWFSINLSDLDFQYFFYHIDTKNSGIIADYEDNDEGYFVEGLKTNHIEHVHQLQNLYFALTGEELKLQDNDKETRN